MTSAMQERTVEEVSIDKFLRVILKIILFIREIFATPPHGMTQMTLLFNYLSDICNVEHSTS